MTCQNVIGPSRFREKEEGGDFAPRGAGVNKPNRPKVSCGKRIQRFWAKQTQSSYLPCSLSVTAQIGPFFRKYECERSIKDSVLRILGVLRPRPWACFLRPASWPPPDLRRETQAIERDLRLRDGPRHLGLSTDSNFVSQST